MSTELYNNKENGYLVKPAKVASKRYCFALDLKNDPSLIAEYNKYHSPEVFWKEIREGILKSGITVMDIYQIDNRMFMICELPIELQLDEVWTQMGTYERQEEWAKLMATFQQALPGHKFEWVKMERVFEL